jgi:hypothetical protein
MITLERGDCILFRPVLAAVGLLSVPSSSSFEGVFAVWEEWVIREKKREERRRGGSIGAEKDGQFGIQVRYWHALPIDFLTLWGAWRVRGMC